MRILGYDITRHKKAAGLTTLFGGYGSTSLWSRLIEEARPGDWQRNILSISQQDVLTNPTAWSCITLIASDIAKLWLNLTVKDSDGICTPTYSPAFSPVLEKPNAYSTRVKFFEYWMLSKLTRGNTYVLKERDKRGIPVRLHILDSSRVTVMVAPDGSVFYSLGTDQLSGLQESVIVPAREIIHDIMVPLFHPLIGVSPIFACGLAAIQGLKIAQNTMTLFANGSQPGGIITAPHHIPPDVAERARQHWEQNYQGAENIGRVAILGDSMSYTPVTMTAVDAQLIDQLNWGDLRICACFHVPPYMVGIGPAPPYTDIQSINLQYYTQALQNPIENIETLLDEGLEFPSTPEYHAEFDLDALLRMDTKTQVDNSVKGILGGLFAPNEERAAFDRKPVAGGNKVFMQQQQFPLEALDRPVNPTPAAPSLPEPAAPKAFDLMAYRRTVLARTKALSDAAA